MPLRAVVERASFSGDIVSKSEVAVPFPSKKDLGNKNDSTRPHVSPISTIRSLF